jgi:hypothetical protein
MIYLLEISFCSLMDTLENRIIAALTPRGPFAAVVTLAEGPQQIGYEENQY